MSSTGRSAKSPIRRCFLFLCTETGNAASLWNVRYEPEAELWEGFQRALDLADLEGEFDGPAGIDGHQWDAAGTIEDVPVVVELKAVPTIADVARLRQSVPKDSYPVVVARRVSKAVASELIESDIGFFDARGRLRIWRRPLLVDTTVTGTTEDAPQLTSARVRMEAPSMLDVALAVLDGSAERGVRATAEFLDRAPGTVSKQLAALRAAGLVDGEGRPMVPDLFEAVVDVWRPVRVPLANLPHSRLGRVNERLQIGHDDPEGSGWVLADVTAAAGWGAPVVSSGEWRPDFYVPHRSVVAQARSLLGAADYGQHACTVAVAPAPYVCRRRYDRSRTFDTGYLLPSPVVAALDLAADAARGREMLELWSRDLDPEIRRVW